MADKELAAALDQALQRLHQGVSLEECVRPYPHLAGELRPLLRLALAVKRADTGGLAPAAKARGRERFQGAVRLFLEGRRRRGLLEWARPWLRPWAVAAAAFVAFISVGGGTFLASAESMPDEPLYPVKRAAERLQLVLARSPEGEARVHLTLADRRVLEIAHLAQTGRMEEVLRLQEELGREIQLAQASLGLPPEAAPASATLAASDSVRVEEREAAAQGRGPGDVQAVMRREPPPELQAFQEQMQERGRENLARLHLLRARASAEARQALDGVIRSSQEQYASALSRGGGRASQRPGLDPWDRLLVVEAPLEGGPGEWGIAGRPIRVAERAFVGGRPQLGGLFRVGALLQPDGSLLAFFIQSTGDSPEAEEGIVQIAGVVWEIQSSVQAIVGGFPILLGREAQLQSPLRPGRWVQVRGLLREDGSIQAHRVQTSSEGP